MTDPEFADHTYIGPITPEAVEKIIVCERLDYYHAEQLQIIVVRSVRLLNVEIAAKGA